MRRELLGYQELLEEHEGTLKVYNNKLVELRQDLQQKEIRKAELGVALERLSAEQRQAAERLELLWMTVIRFLRNIWQLASSLPTCARS